MTRKFYPTEATLYMTKVCNFYCEGCSRQTVGVKTFNELDIPIIEKALEQYPTLNGFCLAGLGEPTLNNNFIAIVDYLKSHGKYVGIITNGSNIEPFKSLKHQPDYISVSLYGYNKEQYNNYVKLDMFDEVVENFKTLKMLNNSVGFSYFVSKDNIQNLRTVIELAESLNADFLNITNYLVYDTSDAEELSKIIYTSDHELIDEIEVILAQSTIINARPVYLDREHFSFHCASYRTIINIDGNGNIGGCQRQFQPSAEYGNILTMRDPYNNGKIAELRAKITDGEYPHGDNCNYCFGKMNPSFGKKLDLAIYILFHEKVAQTLECIKSFLPFYVPIYILNNGSNEHSIKELESFTNKYQNIKLFHSEKNLGVGVGRNYLIENTSEEWMFFVDNDITIDTYNFMQIFTSQMAIYPDIDVFIPKLFNIHDNTYAHRLKMHVITNSVEMAVADDVFTNIFPGGAAIVNRRVFQKHGLYDTKMFVGLEDFELALGALLNETPIKSKFIDEIDLIHDHRIAQLDVDKQAIIERYDFSKLEASYFRILEKYPSIHFEHEFRPWVIEQIDQMLGGTTNLKFVNSEYQFGASWYRDNELSEPISENYKNIIVDDYLLDDKKTCIIRSVGKEKFELTFYSSKKNGDIKKQILLNIEHYKELEKLTDELQFSDPTRIVLLNTLEHLNDPRPILRYLRALLQQNASSELMIVTNDYDENNINHYAGFKRAWTIDNMKTFLVTSGFIVKQINNKNGIYHFHLTSDAKTYEVFLKTNFLPANNSCMIVSQEHGKAPLTGGIGAYVEEVEKLLDNEITTLLIPPFETMYPPKHYSMQKRHLLASSFYFTKDISYDRLDEITKECIEIALFFYDNLQTIELQDVNGKGYMAIQAYNTGKYPSSIQFKTLCHASRVALERLYERYTDYNDRELYEEKYVIENVDEAIFPTNYLREFYFKQGYVLPKERSTICRLPFDFQNSKENYEQYLGVDTLIFFGKRIHYKGFSYFTALIEALLKQDILSKMVKTIVLVGPKFDEMEKENTFFDLLANKGFDVKEFSLKRIEALNLIKEYRNRSICFTPYVSDNHPNSVLEVVGQECLLLASNKGGIPELIPAEYHSKMLFDLEINNMITQTLHWLQVSPDDRLQFVKKLKQTVMENQKQINQKNMERFNMQHTLEIDKNRIDGKLLIVTYCQSQKDLDKVQNTILSQSIQPEKIIIFSKDPLVLNQGFDIASICLDVFDNDLIHTLENHSGYTYSALMSPECDYSSSFLSSLISSLKHSDSDYVTSNVFHYNKKVKFIGDGLVNATVNNTIGTPFGIYKISSLQQCSSVKIPDIFVNRSFLIQFLSEGFSIKIHPEFLFSSDLPLVPETYGEITTYTEHTKFLNHFDAIRAIGYLQQLKESKAQISLVTTQLIETEKLLFSLTSSKSWKLIGQMKNSKIHSMYMLLKKIKGKF